MSQFIPFVPYEPRGEPRGASWRPLGAASSIPDRAWTAGLARTRTLVGPNVEAAPEVHAPPEPVTPEPDQAELEERRAAEHAEALELVEQEREAMKAEVLRLAAATREMEEATRAMEAAAETLEAGARALQAAHVTLVGELRAEAGGVILEAARRIAGDALHADPRLLNALVDEAVNALGRDGLQVHVSPLDADTLRARMPSLDVVEDFAIEAGCLCVGPAGRIDASLESAMVAVGTAIERWAVGG
jgi:flagellar biosynthesis/type III secretory pathway protein FliH